MAKQVWKYWEPKFQADKVCDMNPVWPWGGHRRFAYDLVRWMRPGRIAELGVHWGTSFFTFAQAMKDGRMKDTELIGVDTFEGEEHAGKYGSEVLDTVRRIVKASFPKQSITLHQMFFADALPLVADESVDLIHIDGLHTFEAVKEDFETWLPKLAPDGVMLFHDVAPDTGYGSTDYWNQLSTQHPSFAFDHSWGLGVLFPKGDARFQALEALGLTDKLVAYPAIARAERAAIEARDLGRMAEERMATIQKQSNKQAELRERLEALRESTVPAEAQERALARATAAEKLAVERQEAIKQQSEKIRLRDEAIEKRAAEVEAARTLAKERYEVIQTQSDRIRRRDETITGLRQDVRKREEAVARLDKRAGVAEAAREELRQQMQGQQQRIDKLLEHQSKLDQRLERVLERETKLREEVAAGRAATERLQSQLGEAGKARERLESLLADMATHVSALATSHEKDRRQAAERFAALGDAIERSRLGSEAAARAFRERLALLDVDADLQSLRSEHLETIVADQPRAARADAQGRARRDRLAVRRAARVRHFTVPPGGHGAEFGQGMTKAHSESGTGNRGKGSRIAWLVPQPLEGSGGHRTILQNIEALETAGHECHVFVEDARRSTDATPEERLAEVRAQFSQFFGFTGERLHLGFDIPEGFDLAMATAWYTAAFVARPKIKCKKAYFVQDYEAYFMPVNDGYLKAEDSYSLGLPVVSIGRWLSQRLARENGCPATFFEFCADGEIYRPDAGVERERAVCAIYQPEKPRRCPNLLIQSLGVLKRHKPDVKIYLYGTRDKPDLPFEHEHLGLLSVEECAALYSRCSAGLCISATNPSRIPFEMMACGLPVVDIHRPNNLFDMPEHGVLLAAPRPDSLARALAMVLDDEARWSAMSTFAREYMRPRTLEYGFKQFVGAVEDLLAGRERAWTRRAKGIEPMYHRPAQLAFTHDPLTGAPVPRRRALRPGRRWPPACGSVSRRWMSWTASSQAAHGGPSTCSKPTPCTARWPTPGSARDGSKSTPRRTPASYSSACATAEPTG
ncbi:MAG: hypothetical protein HND58_00560 [Planctomycetota bacterium]|nr:MAG: hypothetical protein HND58_00560 [Planctomycetota bacterium]